MSGLLVIGIIVLIAVLAIALKKSKTIHEGSNIRYQISRD
jgi:hypothetical protein